jgi:hypothetical protein
MKLSLSCLSILYDLLLFFRRDRQFIFAEPVDGEANPSYYEVIKNPIDLATIKSKIDREEYSSLQELQVNCV